MGTPSSLYGYTVPLASGKTAASISFASAQNLIVFGVGISNGSTLTATTTSLSSSSTSSCFWDKHHVDGDSSEQFSLPETVTFLDGAAVLGSANTLERYGYLSCDVRFPSGSHSLHRGLRRSWNLCSEYVFLSCYLGSACDHDGSFRLRVLLLRQGPTSP